MNDKIKAVIVDDEETAIDNLCFELKKYQWVSVEGIAHNGNSGIRLIEKEHPDLLFLDVELPDMLGMDVAIKVHEIQNWDMHIIFYTAYNKYLIDALRNYAFDFLLKPVDPNELAKALGRLRETGVKNSTNFLMNNGREGEKSFMVVTPMGDLRVLRVSDIGYFRYVSDRKIWEVALANGSFIPLKRNTRAEHLCAYDPAFVQIHQSYIINMNYLLMVQGGQCVMYPPFNEVDELQVSKKYKKEMMERFCQL